MYRALSVRLLGVEAEKVSYRAISVRYFVVGIKIGVLQIPSPPAAQAGAFARVAGNAGRLLVLGTFGSVA